MFRPDAPKAILALVLAAASVGACGSAPEDVERPADDGALTARDAQLAQTANDAQSPSASPAGASGSVGPSASPPRADPPPAGPLPEPVLAAPGGPRSAERQLAAQLGLGDTFLIGLGNDATSEDANQNQAYGLGSKLDIHYMYLSGLDWPEWNAPAGHYVTLQANAAKSRGVVPMFTLYQAAANGENNLAAFDSIDFMTKYWRGVRIMFERLGELDSPAVVHVEPDLWGYTQAHSELRSGTPMKVGSLVPECTDLPSDVSGMARCVIRLSRQLAPKVVIGLSASTFGAFTNGYSDATRIASYMKAIGGDEADLMIVETLDRDAGCFESASDPNCKRSGSFYWDESNVAHPNFHDHLAWARTIRDIVGKPLLWWQMPLGVPASTAGGAGHYRDNRVRYLFSHATEFAAAGGIGAVFGTGAGSQTDTRTDGGQFSTAVAGYYASPAALR